MSRRSGIRFGEEDMLLHMEEARFALARAIPCDRDTR